MRVYELSDSMSGSLTTELESAEVREVKRRYVVGQAASFNAVVEAMDAYTPRYAAEPPALYWTRSSLDVKAIGNKYFDVTATYRTLVPTAAVLQESSEQQGGGGGGGAPPPAAGSVAWDTTGRTEHITQALSEERYPGDATDFEEAINVSGDSVQGLDVVRPGMRYTETWIIPAATAMSATFVQAVHRLTGTVNELPFRSFDPGECLFLGARGQWSGDSPYVAVAFEFEARPNVDDFYVKGIEPFAKRGWEYVWIRYQPEGGADIIRRPIAVYKNRVYREAVWDSMLIAGRSIAATRSGSRGRAPLAGLPQGF